MLIRSILLAALLISLSACCCPCNPKSILPLPAALSPEEQVTALTAWAHSLPRLKATTVLAGVRLDYRDDKGQDKSVNAEGILQIQQHIANGPGAPAPDVLLLGKSFDQNAFEAGRNAKDWWFAVRLDTKKAWIGDATHAVNFANLGNKDSASILRADIVPDLLGLSELPTRTIVTSPGLQTVAPFLTMLVNDADGTNDLLITQTQFLTWASKSTVTETPFIQREIIVDRRTGHITEVRLYSPDGILAVRSQLLDYVPVTYAAGVDKPATIPEFPRKVTVSYPGQFLTVALEFDTITVVPEFRPAVFTTPDFKNEGLRVIPAE